MRLTRFHPLLVAAQDIMVGEPFLFSAPRTPSFTLPSSINLFTRHLNVSVIDWVEGLKKLSLNSIELQPPISAAIIEKSPSGLVIEPTLPDSICSPTESSDSGYFLRSCTKGGTRGLGRNPVGATRGRGHVSHLARAQSRAKKDVQDGKQLPINKALRAMNSRKKSHR